MEGIAPIGSVGEPHATLVLLSVLMFGGVVAQFIFKMARFENQGHHYTPLSYLRLHPWNALAALVAAWILMWIGFEMGECTRLTAVLIGLGCESAVSGLRKIADSKMKETTP